MLTKRFSRQVAAPSAVRLAWARVCSNPVVGYRELRMGTLDWIKSGVNQVLTAANAARLTKAYQLQQQNLEQAERRNRQLEDEVTALRAKLAELREAGDSPQAPTASAGSISPAARRVLECFRRAGRNELSREAVARQCRFDDIQVRAALDELTLLALVEWSRVGDTETFFELTPSGRSLLAAGLQSRDDSMRSS